jgi:hypothetical protein
MIVSRATEEVKHSRFDSVHMPHAGLLFFYAPIVVAIIMPLIVGALTGLTAAFVATALPLVLRMQAGAGDPMPIAVLALSFHRSIVSLFYRSRRPTIKR